MGTIRQLLWKEAKSSTYSKALEAVSLSMDNIDRSDKPIVVLSLVFILLRDEKERSHSELVTAIVKAIWTVS